MFRFDTAGNITILIRALSDMNILGTLYNKDDVVSIIPNASFDIVFDNDNKTINQGAKNLMGFSSLTPNEFIIKPKLMSDSMFNFIAAKSIIDKSIYIPKQEKILTDEDGNTFLSRMPEQNKNFVVKDLYGVKQNGFIVNYETGQISGLEASTNFTVSYYTTDISLITYDMKKVELSYFQIEATGDANVNGISRKLLINIPRAALSLDTVLGFNSNEITNTSIAFKIINGELNISYY